MSHSPPFPLSLLVERFSVVMLPCRGVVSADGVCPWRQTRQRKVEEEDEGDDWLANFLPHMVQPVMAMPASALPLPFLCGREKWEEQIKIYR